MHDVLKIERVPRRLRVTSGYSFTTGTVDF